MHMNKSATCISLVCLLAALSAPGCGGEGSAPAAGAAGGGMPPAGVEVVNLEAKPIEDVTEFVGTIKSRASTDIQPQVEGFLTRISVKSGDRVQAGATLMEIDSRVQQGTVAGLESVRAQREIEVAYARQEADRAAKLLEAGAASQMDSDRAANALKGAQAQLRTIEEQISTSRTDLGYYRVTAPTAGVVGDIPVRVGDRVTKATVLTTVDANRGLEVYLNVPVQQAPRLTPGLPVRLLDEAGAEIGREAITFVSPSVDTTTQTVLVKTPVSNASGFRTDQYVRAQVIWGAEPGLTIPVTSVTRINGQWFAFVAEPGPGGKGLVARQRSVQLGPVNGSSYTVVSGIKPGERLITSGIQKIGEGAPVQPVAAVPTTGTAPVAGAR